jgi:HTH-type transcriptional regulator, sugar sensing transcriptional regulator
MATIDLTPFGFTPTESLVYEVLLRDGPGTGYAIARSAGLARANAYSSLEGLVSKGAARVELGRPKQYRPESPATLIARISNNYGQALDQLSSDLDGISRAASPTIVEIDSGRTVLQLITHDVTRANSSVDLLTPPDAYPLLAPALRRPVSAGIRVALWSITPVPLEFSEVRVLAQQPRWPGMPIVSVVDDRSAIIGSRNGAEVHGHWSTAPWFVAAARLTLERLGAAS